MQVVFYWHPRGITVFQYSP